MPDLRILALVLALPAAANAACRETTFEGTRYTTCETTFGQDDLRLWVTAPDGVPVGTFGRLADLLATQGKHIGFAMNAGMYAPDLRPLGLAVVDGRQIAPLVTGASAGNFGLLPNGVFCIGPDRYAIIETRAYAAAPPACREATQSGPMLVIRGALHPRFLPDSGSTYIRNGCMRPSPSPMRPSPSTPSPASSAMPWGCPTRSTSTATPPASPPPICTARMRATRWARSSAPCLKARRLTGCRLTGRGPRSSRRAPQPKGTAWDASARGARYRAGW